MKTLIVTAATTMIATSAFAQSITEKTGVNSLVGVAPSTEDFVQGAATSDMFEIASSKLAEQRGDAATKAFAKQMVTDHQKTTSQLKGLVSTGKVKATLPAAMTDDQKDTLEKLNSLQGKEFADQYHSGQVDAHEHAVDLFERYSKGGDQADLKAWAGKTLPTLQHHLEMAKALNK